MAKGKRAAALFEVIYTGREPKPLFSGARGWFSRRRKSVEPGALITALSAPHRESAAVDITHKSPPPRRDANDPTIGRDPQEMLAASAAAARARLEAEQAVASPTPADARVETSASAAQPAFIIKAHDQSSAGVERGGAAAVGGAGVDVALDPQHQQITFKFSYTSAIVAGFAIVVTVLLAYLVGQRVSRGPALALATQTSEQLRAGPARPDVLDVQPRKNALADSDAAKPASMQQQPLAEAEAGTSSRSTDQADVVNPDASGSAGARINNVPAPTGPRTMNLNYIVIQSYPDEKSAIEARDALLKAGVGCTIERGLRGLKADWHTVVGTHGFTRLSGDECKEYVRKIEQISTQFAEGKRSFKAFQPMGYKWDKPGANAPQG